MYQHQTILRGPCCPLPPRLGTCQVLRYHKRPWAQHTTINHPQPAHNNNNFSRILHQCCFFETRCTKLRYDKQSNTQSVYKTKQQMRLHIASEYRPTSLYRPHGDYLLPYKPIEVICYTFTCERRSLVYLQEE